MSGNITQQMLGGARRKNGHKTTCNCHICENMRLKAKRGGYQEEYNKKVSGGSKKKNGHKAHCKCPICKNMSKKMKKGGDGEPDIENQKGDIEEEGIISTMNQPHEVEEEVIETDGDNYDEIDELDRAELGESGPNKVGGTRRRRRNHKRKTRRNKKHSRRHRKK